MKLSKYLFLSLFTLSIVACSSDDDSSSTDAENTYLPLSEGNNWTYNNTYQVNDTEPTESTETITAESSSNNSYTFTSDASPENQGPVTSILTNGEITINQSTVNYTGSFVMNMSELGLDEITVPLTNVVIYDVDANSGDNLFSVSNSLEQTIELQGQQVPLIIDYEINNVQDDFYTSYPVNGETYNDVISTTMSVTVSANVEVGPLTVPVMQEQTVLVATNYYANHIGMILNESTYNYSFEDLSDFGAPAMPETHIEASQALESYTVIEE